MRAFVFFLVLANVLLYAWSAGYFVRPGNADAARVEQQVKPERVRIVGYGSSPPAKGADNGQKAAEAARPPEPEELCLAWERLPSADADRLAATLAEKIAGVRAERRAVAFEGGDWWVLIPPQASKAEADKKAGELRQLGIADYFIVQDPGPNRYAISLGVFSAERGAQERLNELKGKGVKSARFQHRNGRETHAAIEVRGPAPRRADILAVAAEIAPKTAAQDCR